MKRFEEAAKLLPLWLCKRLMELPAHCKAGASEIRLRTDRPASITVKQKNLFLTAGGISPCPDGAYIISREQLFDVFTYICQGSVYSRMDQLNEGYITLQGGHRAGISGRAVTKEGLVQSVSDISSINLRIARQIKGCGEEACRIIYKNGFLRGTLLLSPPSGGKTTLLRDIARILSVKGIRVCVVDSRGEIAACHEGVPMNDLGPLCDVLDGYPKAKGISQAIRTLSPEVVICDEIGGAEECDAIAEGMNAGVPVIASAHAGSVEEAIRRPQLKALLQTGAIGWIICLAGAKEPGRITEIKDYCRKEPVSVL